MKWLRIGLVIAIGIAIFFQQYLTKNPDVKESEGKSADASKNLQIVQKNKDLLPPDMRIDPPKQLYLRVTNGVKKIRFNTTFYNVGKGPLELIGVPDEEKNVVVATQIINKIDGSKESMQVGEFIFHPGHNHWHVDKYAQFQVFTYDENGGP